MNLRLFSRPLTTVALVVGALIVADQPMVLPGLMVINERDAAIGLLIIIPQSITSPSDKSSDDTHDPGFDSGRLGELEA